MVKDTKKGCMIVQAGINEDGLAMCRYDDEQRHADATQIVMCLFEYRATSPAENVEDVSEEKYRRLRRSTTVALTNSSITPNGRGGAIMYPKY